MTKQRIDVPAVELYCRYCGETMLISRLDAALSNKAIRQHVAACPRYPRDDDPAEASPLVELVLPIASVPWGEPTDAYQWFVPGGA